MKAKTSRPPWRFFMHTPFLWAVAVNLTTFCSAQPSLGWVAQIGGSGSETAAAVSRDSQGNLYIAGTTNSTDLGATGFQMRLASPGLVRAADDLNSAKPLDVPASDSGANWTVLHPPGYITILA